MTKYEVNIEELLANKLSFEAHFILYCLYKKDKQLVELYVKLCKRINTEIFNQLAIDGYLLINNKNILPNSDGKIYFSNLVLLEKGRLLFDSLEEPALEQKNFLEFRNNYPSTTKNGRRLHTNLSKCRKLYKDITREIPHEVLCKCARLYVHEKKITNSEEYIQQLVTWLHQRNYEAYIHEEETNNLTNNDHSEDI